MKIMTFNIRADNVLDINNRWEKRKELVYKTIRKYDCDIVGLQEVTEKMYQDISKELSEYMIIGEGRTKKYFSEKNSLLIKKDYKILKHETFWLSKTPQRVGSTVWYSLFPRICTSAVCKAPNGQIIKIYNTHLDCLLPKAREYGLKKIADDIKKYYEEESLPCVLMGDFNATPNSRVIKKFSGGEYTNKKFIAVQEFDRTIYKKATMGTFKGREKGMHIDYIFVSEEFNIKHVEIIRNNINGKYPSDHYPIMATIQV